jgi:hypothetical protein
MKRAFLLLLLLMPALAYPQGKAKRVWADTVKVSTVLIFPDLSTMTTATAGGAADSSVFATIFFTGLSYSPLAHNHTGTYQPAGTYLGWTDSTAMLSYVKSQVALKALSASPTLTGGVNMSGASTIRFHTGAGTLRSASDGYVSATASDTAGLAAALAGKQVAGTYLVPSDSTSVRNRSNVLYQSAGSYQAAGTYLVPADSTTMKNGVAGTYLPRATAGDSVSARTNTSARAGVVASGSGQNAKVWKTDASGNPDWRDDSTGVPGAGDIEGVSVTAPITGGGTTGTPTIGADTTTAATGLATIARVINGLATKQASGTYLVPSDSTSIRNRSTVMYQAAGTYLVPSDSTSIRNRSNALYQSVGTYLVPSDSTSIRNRSTVMYQAAGTYLVPSDSTSIRNRSNVLYQAAGNYQAAGTYIVPTDTTTQRTYSTSLYQVKDADLTTIAGLTATTGNMILGVASAWASSDAAAVKTALSLNNVTNESKSTMFTSPAFTTGVTFPTAMTGTVRAASGVISATASDTAGLGTALAAKAALTAVLKNADSTSIRNYSASLYAPITASTAYLKNADSTTMRNHIDADFPAKATFPVVIGVACSDESTALTASTSVAKYSFRMPFAMTVTSLRANVVVCPTGATILVDIHEGATTICNTKIMIDATEYTSVTGLTGYSLDDASLADDAIITIYVDQIGSTIAGAGLKVWIIGTRSL